MIDLYCERLGPGLWAEPLNAGTNVAFLITAYFAWQLARRHRLLDPGISLLITLVIAIGIGSFLFHIFATRWAAVADVLPIVVFQIAFLWVYGGCVLAWGRPARLLVVAALITGIVLCSSLPRLFNGSLVYAPALLVLFGLGITHLRHRHSEPWLLLAATGVLAIALTARSIDLAICEQFPVGSHFVWHCLNGLVLYLTLRGLMMSLACRGTRPTQ